MRYFTFSPDGINTIQACGRKYLYNKVMRLVPIGSKDAALEKGDLMHFVLAEHYNIQKEVIAGKSHIPLAEAINEVVERGRQYSATMDIPPSEQEAVVKQYRFYAVHYKDDPWHPLAVEQKFHKVLYRREDEFDSNCQLCKETSIANENKDTACELHEGLTVILEGKIDLVAKHLISGDVYIWDHKTGQRRTHPSKLSNQFIGYAYGVNLHHVIINHIGFQKTIPVPQRFHRSMMAYPDALIDEWRDNVIFWAEQVYTFQKANHYPMNWTSCDKYSGCIYKIICESHPGARQSKIVGNFMVKQHSLFEMSSEEPEEEAAE